MKAATASKPDFWEVIFSVKTFAAGMLALGIAFLFDLQNPYWAMGTAYIVSHPLSGALTSKAIYRLIGTVIGGAASVVIVPNLVNAPVLMTLAIAIWIAICLGIAIMDRSPRAYAFMLSGYTTAAVAFPIVNQPELAFSYAVYRVEEISIGIICAALVGRLFLPRHAGPVLVKRINIWMQDSDRLVLDVLSGKGHSEKAQIDRKKLAVDAVDMWNFTTHVTYDTSSLQTIVRSLKQMQYRMVSLLPLLSGIGDMIVSRNAAIAEAGKTNSPALDQFIAELAQWIETEEELSEKKRESWRRLVDEVYHGIGNSNDWVDMISVNIATFMIDLVQMRGDCLMLRQDIVDGTTHKMRWHRFDDGAEERAVYTDYGMAFIAGLSVALVVIVSVSFWILTAWTEGDVAVTMAVIYCCLFATSDNPVMALQKFCQLLLGAIFVAFVVQFILLPFADGFGTLMLMMAIILIPSGVLLAMPSQYMLGMAISINLPYLVILQSRYNDDFNMFINANIASFLGIVMCTVITALVRSVGAEWSAVLLLKAGWKEIAKVAEGVKGRYTESRLTHRMLERLSRIVPRLAVIPADSVVVQSDLMVDLRMGLNVVELRRLLPDVRPGKRADIEEVFFALSVYYRNKNQYHAGHDTYLLEVLDKALASISGDKPGAAEKRVRLILVSTRFAVLTQDGSPDTPIPQGIFAHAR